MVENKDFPKNRLITQQSVFETTARSDSLALIRFLKLAEREGAYERLSEKRKQALQMRFVEGLSMPQIAERLKISKQAVSQTLTLTPESLYKQMLRDVNTYATYISFTEILTAYEAYKRELEARKEQK